MDCVSRVGHAAEAEAATLRGYLSAAEQRVADLEAEAGEAAGADQSTQVAEHTNYYGLCKLGALQHVCPCIELLEALCAWWPNAHFQ